MLQDNNISYDDAKKLGKEVFIIENHILFTTKCHILYQSNQNIAVIFLSTFWKFSLHFNSFRKKKPRMGWQLTYRDLMDQVGLISLYDFLCCVLNSFVAMVNKIYKVNVQYKYSVGTNWDFWLHKGLRTVISNSIVLIALICP